MVNTVVYADVLVLVNTVVDFLILSFTEKLTKIKANVFRLVLGALVGGISSLSIFLPEMNFFLQLLLRIIISAVTSLTTFGYIKLRTFLRINVCFFASTLLYAGVMYAVYFTAHPRGMQVYNGVVFFNISPLMLIISSTAVYIVLSIGKRIFTRRNNNCKRMGVSFCNAGNTVNTTALIDTGNAVSDIIGNSKIAVVDENIFAKLFPDKGYSIDAPPDKIEMGMRLLPVKTVSGTALLKAKKCDYAFADGKKIIKPLIALSTQKFDDDYGAIVGTDFID